MSGPLPIPIDAATRCCAVYGHPIQHSASPAMQNAGIAALGLNWRYLAFDVPLDQLREAIAGARAMGFLGLNLTVPHKLLALEMVDALDESARAYGAVNTIRFEGLNPRGEWRPLHEFADRAGLRLRAHGFNTDAEAVTRAIREDLGLDPAGSRVLLLGAGGAGRTAALRLAEEGVAFLYLFNRTAGKAAAVAEEIRVRYPAVGARVGLPEPKERVDLLLNATSLGLRPEDPLPLAAGSFSLERAGAVYDMIYRPAETALLRAARAAGCRAANGLSMLLYQGARALELWSGRNAPIREMRQALQEQVSER